MLMLVLSTREGSGNNFLCCMRASPLSAAPVGRPPKCVLLWELGRPCVSFADVLGVDLRTYYRERLPRCSGASSRLSGGCARMFPKELDRSLGFLRRLCPRIVAPASFKMRKSFAFSHRHSILHFPEGSGQGKVPDTLHDAIRICAPNKGRPNGQP